MNEIDIPEKIPNEVLTVGRIISSKTPVKATCFSCGVELKVDLITIAEHPKHGPDSSLVDRFVNCRVYTCKGRMYFEYYSAGFDEWRPLISRSKVREVRDARRNDNYLSSHSNGTAPVMTVDEAIEESRKRKAVFDEVEKHRPQWPNLKGRRRRLGTSRR